MHCCKKFDKIYIRLFLDVRFRAYSSMDRAPACGAGDTSSIPVRRNSDGEPLFNRGASFFYSPTRNTIFGKLKNVKSMKLVGRIWTL